MTTKRIELTLPFPPTELRQNARVHWAVKHARAREYADVMAWELRAVCGWPLPRFARLDLSLIAIFPNGHVWDDSAVIEAFKPARDVLTEPTAAWLKLKNPPPRLGIITDDSPAHFRLYDVEVRIDRSAPARRLEVILEGQLCDDSSSAHSTGLSIGSSGHVRQATR